MKVARLYAAGDIRVDDEPGPGGVPAGHALVRVSAVGLCGSDLHWFAEGGIGDAALSRPLVLGHEMAGVVETGPAELVGRRVAIDPAQPCRACDRCRRGHPNLCPQVRFAGHGECDGGLRERMLWPARLLHPLPDAVSDAGGALLEPLGVALHSLDLGRLRLGSSVAVVGCGPIGLLAVALARAGGATTVVAVEPLEHRRRAALDFGADLALSPAEALAGGLDAASSGLAGGERGVDVALEVAGVDEAVRIAMLAARPGARVVLAGIPDDDRTAFPAGLARRKGLTLTLVRRMTETYPRAIALVRRGLVPLDDLVGARFRLGEVTAAFAHAVSRASLKTIVDCPV